MANLLPSSERRALAVERKWRLVAALATIVAVVSIIGTILLVPSFIVVTTARDVGAQQLTTTRELLNRQRNAGALAEVVSAQEKIKLLNAHTKRTATETIERLIERVPAGVSLHSIMWQETGETTTLDITGSATTRNTLLAFGDQLEASGLFAEVVIPIEALAPQTNLNWRLKLTLVE